MPDSRAGRRLVHAPIGRVGYYLFADFLAPRLVDFFPLFAAVFFIELLLAALPFRELRLLVEVVFAAAALAVRVLRTVLKSPSMKVPTFLFVILGRDAALASERDKHA